MAALDQSNIATGLHAGRVGGGGGGGVRGYTGYPAMRHDAERSAAGRQRSTIVNDVHAAGEAYELDPDTDSLRNEVGRPSIRYLRE